MLVLELCLDGRCRFGGGGIWPDALYVGPLGNGISTVVLAGSFFTAARAEAFLLGAMVRGVLRTSGEMDCLMKTRRTVQRKDAYIQCEQLRCANDEE